jgi:hypothetical protein
MMIQIVAWQPIEWHSSKTMGNIGLSDHIDIGTAPSMNHDRFLSTNGIPLMDEM